MGADNFVSIVTGESARAAFDAAVEGAQYDYGHAGYTGTIAEKGSEGFVSFEVPALSGADDATAYRWAEGVLSPDTYQQRDPVLQKITAAVDDKWGPAGHVALGDNRHLFFGWASS
jgi:hypothetical protein